MEWRIRPPADGEVKVNPIQGQFFTTEGLKEKASALVRETIQNSMDAKTDDIAPGEEKDYPVEIRFFFSGSTAAMPPEKHKKYFEGLMPHIRAEKNGLKKAEIPDFDGPMPFIAIEDFNTTGLTGPPARDTDPEEGTNRENSFYWFWRNVGRSDKGEDERGKWGLGKTVFPYSSRISTFFGITMREEDDEKLLLGQCIFKIHCTDDGSEFTPYGYFGKYSDSSSYFALPLDWDDILDDFEEDFRLKRENLMGFSVIIPFPREELTLMEVAKATSLEYFYPIISGDLRIVLEDGAGNEFNFTTQV